MKKYLVLRQEKKERTNNKEVQEKDGKHIWKAKYGDAPFRKIKDEMSNPVKHTTKTAQSNYLLSYKKATNDSVHTRQVIEPSDLSNCCQVGQGAY